MLPRREEAYPLGWLKSKCCRRSIDGLDRFPLTAFDRQWLAYTSQKTKQLLKALGIEDCKTAVSSPQSNGMAESFVKTLKRDYLPFIDLENAQAALSCLPEIIERYNEEHPHSALGYLSPMEYQQKKGLTEPKTGQEEPICLIPGYLLSQKVNRTEKHLGNIC